MISEKQRVLPDIPGRTRSRHRKVRSTPGPPQSTAFPHGTKTQGQLHHGKRASGRHLRPPAVHRVSSRNGGTENSSTTMEDTSDGKTDGPQSTASFTERTGRCSRRRPTSRRTRPTRSSYQALHRAQEVTDRIRHDHGHLRWSLTSFLFLLLGLLGCLFPEQLIDHRNRVRPHPTGAPRPLHRSGARTRHRHR